MTAARLLDDLHRRGITLVARAGVVRWTPRDALTDDDRARLAAAKPGLLAELTGFPAYSRESGWPGVTFPDGAWLATPPDCKAVGSPACPVPPWCSRCPERQR